MAHSYLWEPQVTHLPQREILSIIEQYLDHNIFSCDRQEKASDQKSGLEIRTDSALFIYVAHRRIGCLGNFLKNTALEKPSGFLLRIRCSRVQKKHTLLLIALRDQEYATFMPVGNKCTP